MAYHDKLLTPIPLELTDDQALQFIFCQIRADADRIKQWAWTEVERMAALLERRHVLAAHGGVRVVGARAKEGVGADKVMFSTEWDHPDHLENGAATFEHYGYPCSADVSVYDFNALFPCPRGRWVEELAVPRSGALTPHCAILVSEHPAITPSFLENFELFDKQGKVKGILSTDTGQIIAGVKLRRGADLAAQEIFLTARSAFAFDQILRLTQPLRDHLRARNDDNWRYLLLASGRAFAYPTRIKNLSGLTSNPWPVARLEESFVRALGCSPDEAGHFVRKFSLSSLRASMGVIVYLDTRSVEQMAKALGQVKYEPQLLERYLPKVIREFFLERWIRIFQTGIIVEALKDSEYLLEATDFTSMDELDEFLRNHALKVPPQSQSLAEAQPQDPWAIGDLDVPQEVVFGLNERILTLLLSLEKAGSSSERALNPKAKYWAEMTTALIPYVRSTAVRREDIRAYLASAETLAHPALVERFAYAQ
ncbi:hypothetical protein A3K87_16435 [Variovorax paradoxus]|uniref:Uncharacterized protein n=1 Tax=Variovorax paradoxus TaxID=34073 RepID=A0AA91DNV9_VARPD|nr:hypothetical protein A3K87_16435 [Variovorax paradoxus]